MAVPIAAIAAGANLLSGIAASGQRSAGNSASEALMREVYNQVKDLQIPDIEKQKLAYEMLQSAGVLQPTAEEAQQLGIRDAMEDINLDPRLAQAKMQSLEQLQKIGSEGFTDADKAALDLALRQSTAEATSRDKGILQSMDMRGVGSSDAALAQRLAASSTAANQANTAALQEAVEGRKRALDAMARSGDLATAISTQDFGQQAAVAGAKNTREQQNMLQRAGTETRNVDRFNEAQKFNLANAQRIADANVGTRNTQQAANKDLYQQQFNNQIARINATANPAGNLANTQRANAESNASAISGAGAGIGQIIAAFGSKK
jgi:hypothetical protein